MTMPTIDELFLRAVLPDHDLPRELRVELARTTAHDGDIRAAYLAGRISQAEATRLLDAIRRRTTRYERSQQQ